MTMEQLIRRVLAALDGVEVRGRENIDRMLGCMQTLEKIADALKQNRETAQALTSAAVQPAEKE